LEEHSWISVWHKSPLYPGKQEQEKLFNASTQVAPFWQGLDEHSLMLVWQREPENPMKQVQEKLFKESTQVAPF
jgi:hypothetical protein